MTSHQGRPGAKVASADAEMGGPRSPWRDAGRGAGDAVGIAGTTASARIGRESAPPDAWPMARDSRAARPGALMAVYWRGWIPRPSPAPTPLTALPTPAEQAMARAAERERDTELQDFMTLAAGDPSTPWHRILKRQERARASGAGGHSGGGIWTRMVGKLPLVARPKTRAVN